MVWALQRSGDRTFQRNPLASVVCAFEFEPILRISEGSDLPAFQELVRARFPAYSEGEAVTISGRFDKADTFETLREKIFQFQTADESVRLALGSRRLIRETKVHVDRAELLTDMESTSAALFSVYQRVVPKRLGLRYVNLIDPARVGADLGRSVSWADLINPEFICLPAVISNDENTRYSNEVTSRCRSDGTMTLRSGIQLKSHGSPHRVFRFDIDRYIDGGFDPSRIRELLANFCMDIFDIFVAAQGSALQEWMSKDAKDIP